MNFFQRPNPSVAANVLSISLFRFGHNLQKLFDDCGFEEALFGGKINDLKNASSRTLRTVGIILQYQAGEVENQSSDLR